MFARRVIIVCIEELIVCTVPVFNPDVRVRVMTNCPYRSGTVNLNTVNLKFHLIQSYCETISFLSFP